MQLLHNLLFSQIDAIYVLKNIEISTYYLEQRSFDKGLCKRYEIYVKVRKLAKQFT